ncbi:alpha/beta-hydrolase [Xylariaceae sp. FL1272]|nr:alpha/beta-hydrolase [Xylariaceae sp. FL1272]
MQDVQAPSKGSFLLPPYALPTLFLVHGAWQTPPVYQKYIDALQEAGFTVSCPLLPSCSGTRKSLPPTKPSLPEDAMTIRSNVRALVETGLCVLVIMHSYGGAVGSEAVWDDSSGEPLFFANRRAKGLQGGVVHMLYLCGYMLDKEEKLKDYTDVNEEEGWIRANDPGFSYFTSSKVDDPDNEDVKALMPHLRVWPTSALFIPIQYAPWKHIPNSYVKTTNDVGVFTDYQEAMIQHAKDIGIEFRLSVYETYHFVWYSHLKDMVQEALTAASDPRNEAE